MRVALLSILLVAWGCAPVRVTTEATPGTDFSRFRTYAQNVPQDAGVASVRDRVELEIARQLEAKGYRPAPVQEADLVVTFRGDRVSKTRTQDAGDPDANYYVVRDYVEGTLTIDVYERATRELVWHGVGRVDLSRQADVPDAAARAVERVLARFPSQPAP